MKRREYIDWLRNLGILFLFPFHTARVFNDNPEFYVKGAESALASALINVSAFWFMPLLFLLAGMSSYYALRKRAARSYVRERYLRLLVPFFFGCLVIVPPQAYYAMKFHQGYRGSYPDFLWSYFTDFSDWTVLTGISPAHLWFILFLFLISVALLPLMLAVIRRQTTPAWLHDPVLVLLPALGLAALSLMPEIGGENILVYAGYVMLGFLIATSDTVIDMLERYRRRYLCVAVPGAIGIAAQRFATDIQENPLSAVWHSPVCWVTLLAMLGYGKRYLNRPSAFMRYFNPAAFPVYILHQTYLIIAAYYVLREVENTAVAFPVILVVPFCLSILSYEVIRRTPGLRTMFGLRAPRPPARAHARPDSRVA
ncbi:Surface polysaccharide O-acyltransferase, integral membrane enzyme [Streptomyces zhaozhouensis]|uniref:Surface polysaccharide O-acyltransferase, integral membrane enzyme n=1 Tax=Streptomyces zhaozhouensis TaxID=1300267 RepID=A0A286DRX2_9ACTN|nr:acyltransferase family protein [Streptomyces zhaozhouensis]SOD61389.1 Surface polysaccharide O-acyltransferase, integral membrane enzyme [Streptomyces zhaozhouensis]